MKNVKTVSEFRWALEAPGLNPAFMQSAEFDFVNCVIRFSAYEVDQPENPQDWLENPVGPMKFTTYNGCGQPIYEYEIDGLEKMSDGVVFDYTCSGVARRKASFAYRSIKKTDLESKDEQGKVADRKGRNARRGRKHGKNDRRPKATKHRS